MNIQEKASFQRILKASDMQSLLAREKQEKVQMDIFVLPRQQLTISNCRLEKIIPFEIWTNGHSS